MNVLSIQPYHVFNLIIWGRISAVIGLLSHIFLSVTNVLLTTSFKHNHFADKNIYQFLIIIWCVHSFWFIKNLDFRTEYEAFNSHKQCSANDWVKWVVVGKLSHENPSKPVGLKSISPLSKVKFQKLINAFCLIICFWIKNNWEFNINVHVKAYLFPEITDKLKITIWYNEVKSTVFLIEFCESGAVYTDSINFPHKHKCGIF